MSAGKDGWNMSLKSYSVHAQTILDKFKKREKKGDSKEVVEDLEAKLGEVAEQIAASQQAAAEREAAAAGEAIDGSHPIATECS